MVQIQQEAEGLIDDVRDAKSAALKEEEANGDADGEVAGGSRPKHHILHTASHAQCTTSHAQCTPHHMYNAPHHMHNAPHHMHNAHRIACTMNNTT